MMTNRTPEQLKTWARENRGLAVTVAKAMAFAQVERERVDAYIRPIFVRYQFTNDMDRPRNTHRGEILTDPKYLYLSEDEERCKAYYEECDRAHREHGYRGEVGTCPALVAEDLQRRAEQLLLDELGRFVGVDGADFCRTLELRAKALDLAMATALGGVK